MSKLKIPAAFLVIGAMLLGVRPDDIMINMVFVNKEDWSFGKGQPW